MKLEKKLWLFTLCSLCGLPWTAAQTMSSAQSAPAPMAASAETAVPPMIPISGTALDSQGNALTSEKNVTFQIYKTEKGGESLFTETQTVTPDGSGQYKVQLGASLSGGIPIDLFSSGEARWLEVQIIGEQPQPRVLLVSVPYALKAADSATLGGLPPSAFALAGANASASAAIVPAISPDAASTVTATGGTANKLAKFSGSNTIVNSILFDNGTEVGIGTTTPTAVLDVNGTGLFSGGLTVDGSSTFNDFLLLPSRGTATASTDFASQYLKLEASAYNSSTKGAVNPRFQLQAEPNGNNTASPGGTLNLLASNGTASPTETGFSFNTNGTINFAPGQAFPGTGDGTITGITAGTDLTGGGNSGHVTLNLDATKIPSLAGSNSYAETQTILSGDLNLPATTSASSGVLNIGGVPFLHGYKSGSTNVFVGGSGNFTTTGKSNEGSGHSVLKALTSGNFNTANGESALTANTTGSANAAFGGNTLLMNTTGVENTAIGHDALFMNSTGSDNTVVGIEALFNNFTGINNTAVGAFSGTGQADALTNTTAIGYGSVVQQNNSLVLGITQAGSPGAQFVNVGIGTAQPRSALEATVSASGALGPVLTLTNSGSGANTSAAIDFNTFLPANSGLYTPGARITAVDDGLGDSGTNLVLSTNSGSNSSALLASLVINSLGQVVLATQESANLPFLVVGPAPSDFNGIESVPAAMSVQASCDGCDGGLFVSGGPGGAAGDFFGDMGLGLHASSVGTFAAYFENSILVGGTAYSALQVSRIDNPLDPANKYFVHASVQSSEMMNIYSGNVTTDELGLATITLPVWFEVLNTDFRYQLTTIGRDAHAWIAEEVANKQFKIATNAARVKVSWQITAVRQDAYAKAHPIAVEQEKAATEKGFYQHPELYGQPAEKKIKWPLDPEVTQEVKAQREAAKLHQASPNQATPTRPKFGTPASAVNRQFALTPKPTLKPMTEGRP